MEEIDAAESTGDDGIHITASTFELNPGISTNMREDVALAQFNEGKLAVVAVGIEIWPKLAPRYNMTSHDMHATACALGGGHAF